MMSRTGCPARMWWQMQLGLFRHGAGPLQHAVIIATGDSGGRAYFLHEFGQVGHLFDADDVELGAILFGDRKRELQRVKGVIRAVVCVQDRAEHATPRLVSASASWRGRTPW